MLSMGASRFASRATESALKFGELASQKVVQVTETVGEKVSRAVSTTIFFTVWFACLLFIRFFSFYPLHFVWMSSVFKVKEGRLLDDVASSVSSVASKVSPRSRILSLWTRGIIKWVGVNNRAHAAFILNRNHANHRCGTSHARPPWNSGITEFRASPPYFGRPSPADGVARPTIVRFRFSIISFTPGDGNRQKGLDQCGRDSQRLRRTVQDIRLGAGRRRKVVSSHRRRRIHSRIVRVNHFRSFFFFVWEFIWWVLIYRIL